MVFELQRYLEDLFERRQLNDVDQYAVKLANLYDQGRHAPGFETRMRRISTSFFRINGLDRADYEASLLKSLDRKFKKKSNPGDVFPGGVARERARLRRTRRNIKGLLELFKAAVEARAVDAVWESRKKGKLKRKPESIAQALLAMFAKGALSESGLVQRELASGTGWVDLQIIFARTPHLIELKILTGSPSGAVQLATYMKHESRNVGWLVYFDARPPAKKTSLPSTYSVHSGTIHVISIDIHPTPPSKRR